MSERRALAWMWFGALGAAGAWTVHVLLAPPLVALACEHRQFVPLLAAVFLPLAGAAAAGLVSLRLWRKADAASDGDVLAVQGLLGATGVFLAAVFVAMIVMGSAAIVFIEPCL